MTISVIICTYNTKEMTLECLDKLKKSIEFLNEPVETIVVENGTDGTGDVIKKKYPWVKLITPPENTGYAKGNNLGIKAAGKTSKYFLFLNTDAFLEPETLRKSIDFMQNNSNCDVLGCRLILGDGSVQPSGGFLPTPFTVWKWIWGIDILPGLNMILNPFHPRNKNFFKSSRELGWVMGAYLFMKREVVEKTKGFDENFFLYTEEVEWCKRINDAGFKIWYTPDFAVTHLDKASSKKFPEKMRKIFKMEILGVDYFIKKYYPKQANFVKLIMTIGLYTRVLASLVVMDREKYLAYIETIKEL